MKKSLLILITSIAISGLTTHVPAKAVNHLQIGIGLVCTLGGTTAALFSHLHRRMSLVSIETPKKDMQENDPNPQKGYGPEIAEASSVLIALLGLNQIYEGLCK